MCYYTSIFLFQPVISHSNKWITNYGCRKTRWVDKLPTCFWFPNGKNNLSCALLAPSTRAAISSPCSSHLLAATEKAHTCTYFFFAHFCPSFQAHVNSSDISPFFWVKCQKWSKKKNKIYYSGRPIAVGKSKILHDELEIKFSKGCPVFCLPLCGCTVSAL